MPHTDRSFTPDSLNIDISIREEELGAVAVDIIMVPELQGGRFLSEAKRSSGINAQLVICGISGTLLLRAADKIFDLHKRSSGMETQFLICTRKMIAGCIIVELFFGGRLGDRLPALKRNDPLYYGGRLLLYQFQRNQRRVKK
jgi:hypothetical protein